MNVKDAIAKREAARKKPKPKKAKAVPTPEAEWAPS
jgi:hypothetical protein